MTHMPLGYRANSGHIDRCVFGPRYASSARTLAFAVLSLRGGRLGWSMRRTAGILTEPAGRANLRTHPSDGGIDMHTSDVVLGDRGYESGHIERVLSRIRKNFQLRQHYVCRGRE